MANFVSVAKFKKNVKWPSLGTQRIELLVMQDKGPLIEELEEAMQRLHEERANALLERRAADNADEMAEIESAVTAAKAALAKGGGTATATAAALAAVARDARSSTVPQFDEFGRDVNLQKRMESKRRAQARERRAKLANERRLKAMKFANGDSARTMVSISFYFRSRSRGV